MNDENLGDIQPEVDLFSWEPSPLVADRKEPVHERSPELPPGIMRVEGLVQNVRVERRPEPSGGFYVSFEVESSLGKVRTIEFRTAGQPPTISNAQRVIVEGVERSNHSIAPDVIENLSNYTVYGQRRSREPVPAPITPHLLRRRMVRAVVVVLMVGVVVSIIVVASTGGSKFVGKGSPASEWKPIRNYTELIDRLPASLRISCQLSEQPTNASAGETAKAACAVAGTVVQYTGFSSQAAMTTEVTSIGNVALSGSCEPTGEALDSVEPFAFYGRRGTVWCQNGNGVVANEISWSDESAGIAGFITSAPGSYGALYATWLEILPRE